MEKEGASALIANVLGQCDNIHLKKLQSGNKELFVLIPTIKEQFWSIEKTLKKRVEIILARFNSIQLANFIIH